MDENDIKRALVRIALEILEKNKGANNVALVGIRTRGAPLAERMSKLIGEIEEVEVPVGRLDVTLHRDYLSRINKKPQQSEMPFEVNDKKIILVDEVIYTGRTARAAMDALIEFGRPQKIQLAVLIDRGHRELPIRPDYVGRNIPTSKRENVVVSVKEIDGEDKVEIEKSGG